ncbi:MAG: Oligopeptide transport system permease protein OppC [uncultured Thermomicrobiales bacterium]|uniref:Oligopeptide transport system permease protein OppC n=1 Tax=uncultured Thermomicrobiales bacterium TaxID=1645740 RepID=A0A6J4UEI7_9BACT|nr:MAG: Oligopeptide transport system permease protein OppC [uncultured Thermomicrobiales bacterium]
METTVTATGPSPLAPPAGGRRFWVISYLMKDRVGTAGLVIFAGFVFLAIFGPSLTQPAVRPDVTNIYGGPSWDHPLGTDYSGRDVLSQIVRGGRSIMVVGALAAFMSTMIAVTFGSLAAYLGGWFDSLVLTITDIVLTIPYIILLGVLAAYVKLNSPYLLAIIIASVAWPTLLRAVRSQVLSLKEREYVEAARVLDMGTRHVLFREILPNMANYILINFVIAMTSAIYGQIILYFLGLVPLSGNNWGLMINLAYTRGALFFRDSLWYILSPIVAISLLQLSLVMISRSLEGIFNPRLREE